MRVKYSKSRRKSHKRLFRELKGAYGRRKNLVKPGFETLIRAGPMRPATARPASGISADCGSPASAAACLQRRDSLLAVHARPDAAPEWRLNRKSLSELAIHRAGDL